MKKTLEAFSQHSKSQYLVSKSIILPQLDQPSPLIQSPEIKTRVGSLRRPSRFIRFPETITRVGLCRSTIYNRIKEGTFPSPIHLGGRSVAWLEADIDAWIDRRINGASEMEDES